MDLLAKGEMAKIKFIACKDVNCTDEDKSLVYLVMYNPNNIALKLQVERNQEQGNGQTNSESKFVKIKPQDYQFEFIIDGTGASGEKKSVIVEVLNFLNVVYYLKGDKHEPRYLKILYGSLLLKCVLKSVDITYTLFSTDGKPLRAKVNASFTSCIAQDLQEMITGKSSPDVTHMRKLKRSDRLITMANAMYDKNTYYLEVARANGFDNFRNLPEGTEIYFPPVSKIS